MVKLEKRDEAGYYNETLFNHKLYNGPQTYRLVGEGRLSVSVENFHT